MLDFEKTERMMESIYRVLERIAFWNMLTVVFLVLLIIVIFLERKKER